MISSTLLINEPPLQVLPTLAKRIGLNEAIILQQIHYWLSDKRNKNVFEGQNWVYNTYEQWQEQFSFWSTRTIIRTLQKLKNKGIVLARETGVSNNIVKHYSIDYKILDSLTTISDYPDRHAKLSPRVDNLACQVVTPGRQVVTPGRQVVTPNIYKEQARVSETTTETTTDNLKSKRAHLENAPPLTPSDFFNVSVQEDSFPVGEISSDPDKHIKTKSRKRSNAQRASRLSEDWTLSDEWREWAIQAGMFNEQIDLQAEKFKCYWLSTAKNPTKINWFMTWKKWCYDNLERSGTPIKIPQSGSSKQEQTSAITPKPFVGIHPKSELFVNKFRELLPDGEYVSWEKSFSDSEMKLVIDDKWDNRIRLWVKEHAHFWAAGNAREFLVMALKSIAPELLENDPSLNNEEFSIATEDDWNWARRPSKGQR